MVSFLSHEHSSSKQSQGGGESRSAVGGVVVVVGGVVVGVGGVVVGVVVRGVGGVFGNTRVEGRQGPLRSPSAAGVTLET